MKTADSKGKKTDILDQLQGLYQTDPDRFDRLREVLIRQTIESFPDRHRKKAYGLQFQLDTRLRKYKDPVVRMNEMVVLLWRQFKEFQDVLRDPNLITTTQEERRRQTAIIPFRSRQKDHPKEGH